MVAKLLKAAALTHSFSSLGGVGQYEGTWSFSDLCFVIFKGCAGVVAFPKLTPSLFAEGDGVG